GSGGGAAGAVARNYTGACSSAGGRANLYPGRPAGTMPPDYPPPPPPSGGNANGTAPPALSAPLHAAIQKMTPMGAAAASRGGQHPVPPASPPPGVRRSTHDQTAPSNGVPGQYQVYHLARNTHPMFTPEWFLKQHLESHNVNADDANPALTAGAPAVANGAGALPRPPTANGVPAFAGSLPAGINDDDHVVQDVAEDQSSAASPSRSRPRRPTLQFWPGSKGKTVYAAAKYPSMSNMMRYGG
ncbi:unnamed protein product, partial [Amoebophrya sp. A120]